MHSNVLPLFAALALASTLAGAQAPSVEQLQEQAIERLQEYVRVDTTNPPGNETRGSEFFARIFDQAGIAYERAESAPGRGNIWARLEGGDEPALMLLHHMDVVPADIEHWSTDPLGGELRDGFIYGRGTLDDKLDGIVHLQAFLALHAAGKPLDRDVVFMATADEEAGGFFGAGWLVENRPESFEGVGLILNEGGSGAITGEGDDAKISFEIEVTQKVPLWLKLIAEDEPGHGSMPRVTNAVTRLVTAFSNLDDHEFEPRIVPAVDAYFKAIAKDYPEPWRSAFTDMATAVKDDDLLLRLQIENPFLHALTRNACSLTMLEGSKKINVVPPDATGQIDCRLLPDQDHDDFIEEIRQVVNDDQITIERIMGFTPAVSTTDTDLYRIIERVTLEHFPDAQVIPSVATGFTDSHFFRDLGIVAYGYGPYASGPSEMGRFHGNDERVSVENLQTGVAVLLEIVEELVYD
jgi:acetylornithine deacetylase/succinyl-diaminopimelate desuccinylase-like protein